MLYSYHFYFLLTLLNCFYPLYVQFILLIVVCAVHITYRCMCSSYYLSLYVQFILLIVVCAVHITYRCMCSSYYLSLYVQFILLIAEDDKWEGHFFIEWSADL